MAPTVIKPPQPIDAHLREERPRLFLAGSIEMGRAELWQLKVATELADLDLVIFDPRRDNWDPSWRQSIDEPRFREQVEWELTALEASTLIAMYFEPSTRAPVTLLELGLFARSGRLLVCCPEGYWRRGNVEVVCARYGVSLMSSFDELMLGLRERLAA